MIAESIATKDRHPDSAALTTWWEAALPKLSAGCLTVRAEQVDVETIGLHITQPELAELDLPRLAEALGAGCAFIAVTHADPALADRLIAAAGAATGDRDGNHPDDDVDPEPPSVARARMLEVLEPVGAGVLAVEVTLVGRAVCQLRIDSLQMMLLNAISADQDEDDDAFERHHSPDRVRYTGEQVTQAIDAVIDGLVAGPDERWCSDVSRVRESLEQELSSALPGLRVWDIPLTAVACVREAAMAAHRRDLATKTDQLIEELFQLVTPEAVRTRTLAELQSAAREVQRRHHACATNETAKTLAREAKNRAKSLTQATLI